MKRLWGFGALAAACLVACTPSADWKGWVYPDANDLGQSIQLGSFRTFEECQAAALTVLRQYPPGESGNGASAGGDYECGFKCRSAPDLNIEVCKETRK